MAVPADSVPASSITSQMSGFDICAPLILLIAPKRRRIAKVS
jgi:hypothetical protein